MNPEFNCFGNWSTSPTILVMTFSGCNHCSVGTHCLFIKRGFVSVDSHVETRRQFIRTWREHNSAGTLTTD